MPFSFSLERGLRVLLLWHCGLLRLCPVPEAALLFPLPSLINRTFFPLPCGLGGRALGWAARVLVLRPALLQHLKSRGVQVWLWVPNEERDFMEAFGLGASGVITDFPARLRHFLESGGGPSPCPGPSSTLRDRPSSSQEGSPLPHPKNEEKRRKK